MSVARAKGDLVRLNDCVEVIRWHQHLIYVSSAAPLAPRGRGGDSRRQRDSDGSAKVALLSLDASIEAWGVLRDMSRKRRMPSSKSRAPRPPFAAPSRRNSPRPAGSSGPVSTTARSEKQRVSRRPLIAL